MSFISESLKTSQPLVSLPKVDIREIQTEIGFTELRVARFDNGDKVLHLVCPDQRYLTINFGKSAKCDDTDDLTLMKTAINNNVIFTGDTDKGGNKIKRWYSFGQEGKGRVSPTVKFSDLGFALSAAAGVPVM